MRTATSSMYCMHLSDSTIEIIHLGHCVLYRSMYKSPKRMVIERLVSSAYSCPDVRLLP